MKRKKFSIVFVEINDKQLLGRLKDLQAQLNFLIEKYKGKYYSQLTSTLSDIGKSSKAYWSILKSFLIAKNNEYITDFKKKAEIFDSFFANQCSLINTNSHTANSKFSRRQIFSMRFSKSDTYYSL